MPAYTKAVTKLVASRQEAEQDLAAYTAQHPRHDAAIVERVTYRRANGNARSTMYQVAVATLSARGCNHPGDYVYAKSAGVGRRAKRRAAKTSR